LILIDIHEPTQLELLLSQTTDVSKTNLNGNLMADYYWPAIDGHTIQIERKQAGELLSNLNHCEKQLMKYLPNADETILLIEGVMLPHVEQTVVYVLTGDSRFFRRSNVYRPRYSMVMAWLWQLDKSGVTIFQTGSLDATAIAISAMYTNSQKEEHTTLKRYIKNQVKPLVPNPFVETLMNIKNAGIGETKALALIEHFETPFNFVMASEDELCEVAGIGPGIARKIHLALGRK